MAVEKKEKPEKKKTFMQNLKQDVKDGVKHALGFSPNVATSVGKEVGTKDKK
jgi:hypothetical protein